jgi:kynurenine formamidase
MLIDVSLLITKFSIVDVPDYDRITAFGHLGTHIDIMDKCFPLSYLKRNAIVFNVHGIFERDIDIQDVEISLVEPEMFVAFYSGFIDAYAYGTEAYVTNHPRLSYQLIDELLIKKVSLIGVDFPGVRRKGEHTQIDQLCADSGVFIVENMCNLDMVAGGRKSRTCIMNTYPVNFSGLSGLPCRVVAETDI